MYEEHFGLNRRPFAETVDPAVYVALTGRDAALRRLRYGLDHARGPALLFGPPGSGKTLLARRIADELGAPALHLSYPALPAAELLTFLAHELGAPISSPAGMALAIGGVRDRLAELSRAGIHPLLIVDEAHLITDSATFESLRMLLNFTTDGTSDLSILLVGTAELLQLLPPALADRMTARCLLGPLSEGETASYVEGRLRVAGAKSVLFTPPALVALHRFADGLPRRLNHLADLSLLVAYAQQLDQVDPRTVAIAAREFHYDQDYMVA